eukprot:3958465-Amphidinium_carterae.1
MRIAAVAASKLPKPPRTSENGSATEASAKFRPQSGLFHFLSTRVSQPSYLVLGPFGSILTTKSCVRNTGSFYSCQALI